MNRIGRRMRAAVNPVSTAATRWWCHSALRHMLTGYGPTIDPRHGRDEWPAELFVFRGADRAAAHRSIERLLTRLSGSGDDAKLEPWRLRDLALAASRAADARTDRAWVSEASRANACRAAAAAWDHRFCPA